MPTLVWNVEDPIGQAVLWGMFGLGWAILLTATFLINHFELFGLQQVYENMRGAAHHAGDLQDTGTSIRRAATRFISASSLDSGRRRR